MITRTIPASALPTTAYARHVALHGHEPGILAGRDLRGSAHGLAWYTRERCRVRETMRAHGIVECPERGIWICARSGDRVRVEAEEAGR